MSSQNHYISSPTSYSKPQYVSSQLPYQHSPPNPVHASPMNQVQLQQQYGASQHSYQSPPQQTQVQPEDFTSYTERPPGQPPIQSFKEYLRTLPMFTLLTEHEARAKQETAKIATDLYGCVQPEPQLTGLQKLSMHLMDATTGGVTNVNKYSNNLIKFSAGNMTKIAVEGNAVTLTRWAYVSDDTGRDTTGLVLVDVLQCRRSKSAAMGFTFNSAYVKAAAVGSDVVNLTVLGKNVKIKGNKMWTKNMSSKDVDGLLLDSRVQMEPLMTVQVTMSIAELAEALKRFEHGWKVPML